MIFLEIAMLVIGIAAVVFSYRLVKEETALSPEDEKGEILKELKAAIKELQDKAETVSEDLEDKMGQMSNEKIMGINEYSDQVLDKIDKTHEEVVFLYDMMNEKQDEMKSLIHSVDSQKAELRDEAVIQFQKMKEQERILDELKKEIEVDFLQFQTERGKFREDFNKLKEEYSDLERGISDSMKNFRNYQGQESAPAVSVEEIPVSMDAPALEEEWMPVDETVPDEDFRIQEVDEPVGFSAAGDLMEENEEPVLLPKENAGEEDFSFDTSSVFDAEIARIEEEESRERKEPKTSESSEMFSSGYVPLAEQEQMENHNDEIVSLYKKGRSILEISKMLSLGQGEVKFVIDLYNARI